MGWQRLAVARTVDTLKIFRRRISGFTLVELLVSMAIVGIVLGAIYSLFISQSRTSSVQEQVVTMQKNLRAAIYFMEGEVRMAGYDPTNSAAFGITDSSANTFSFSLDLNEDGVLDSGETTTYALNGMMLEKNGDPIAENIDAVLFEYLKADGTTPANNGEIHQVVITVVARTARADPRYTDNNSYVSLLGTTVFTVPSGDTHYRRQLLSTRVECRNLD